MDPQVGRGWRRESRDGQTELGSHHSSDGHLPIVQRHPPPDDVGAGTKPSPQRGRNHDAAVVSKPAADEGVHAHATNQSGCGSHSADVFDVALERQVEALGFEPTEDVEAGRPPLVLQQVADGVGSTLSGLAEPSREERHEPLALRIGQGLQHHGVDDGVDCGGRSDADRERDDGEDGNRFGAFPRLPRVSEHVKHRLHSDLWHFET